MGYLYSEIPIIMRFRTLFYLFTVPDMATTETHPVPYL